MKWYRVTDADGTDLGFFSAPSSASIQTVMQLIQWRFGAGANVGISGQPPAGTNIINMTFSDTGTWNTGVFGDTGGGPQATGAGVVTPPPPPTAPPYVPPAGGVGQAEYGPYTQYLAQIRRGAAEYGPAAGYERGLYDPLRTLFGLEETFAPPMGAAFPEQTGPGKWGDYLGRGYAGVGGQQSMYDRAGEILRQQMRLTPAERASAGVSWAQTLDPFSQELAYGEDAVDLGTQQALLMQALSPSYGIRGARRFATRLPREQEIWQQERGAGSQEGFLDYLNAKYGLGSRLPA